MEIFFATNRNALPASAAPTSFGSGFSQNGLADLRFGIAVTEDGKKFALQVAPEQPPSDNVESIFGSQVVFEQLRAQMQLEKRGTFWLIHGYNVSFEQELEGAYKFAQAFKRFNFNICLLSWPSNGGMLYHDYVDDTHYAEASGQALARAIRKGIKFQRSLSPDELCGQKTYLGCHSMGNRAFRSCLQALQGQWAGHLPCLIDQAFLWAADEDYDCFETDQKLMRISELARKVHVYFNNYDKALDLSTLTKGNPTRLGHDGPRKPLDLPGNVTLVDVSRLNGLDLIGHSYYYENPYVVEDISAVLDGQEASKISGREYEPGTNRYKIFR